MGIGIELTTNFAQHINRIVQSADQIREYLGKVDTTVPSSLLESLNQLTISINTLQGQFKTIESSIQNLQALVEVGQVINSSLELSEVLQIVMDTIVRLSKAERGFLMLRNQQGELVIRVARNWEQESLNQSELTVSRTVINQVISDGQPVLTTNAQQDPRFDEQRSIVAYNLRSILCVPLMQKNELIGVIYADNRLRSGIFTENEKDLLAAYANQAAVAIENARLFVSVRATLAEVTELKNLMDNVFSSIASGVITADIEDKITLCNRAAEKILGKHKSELIGNKLSSFLPVIASSVSAHIDSVWQTDQNVIGVEYKSDIPARGQLDLSFNFSPLKDASQITQGVAIVLDDLTEKKRLEGQRRLFERMVSPAVIEQLDPDQLALGGKRTTITVLYTDIHGFTGLSEQIPPEQLISVLNRYLAAAADAVLAHQGTIDKFLGDAIMAWFNAPVAQPDHSLRAVLAALDIRRAIRKLRAELPTELRLSFGTGIHCGEAIMGLIGTEKMMNYTAIGDSVNTAKRIQENAAGNQILVSEEIYQRVAKYITTQKVEAILAKGKSRPIVVYEVLGIT